MIKSIGRVALLFTAAFFLIGAGSDVLYVQSTKAKVMKDPSFKSSVVLTAKKGQEMQVISKKGRWYEVKVDGKKGWVSRLLVSKRPPLKKVSVFAKSNEQDISSKARRRASVRTTAAAARGLAEDDRRRVGATKVDYAAVEKMEAINITDSEVDSFVEQAR